MVQQRSRAKKGTGGESSTPVPAPETETLTAIPLCPVVGVGAGAGGLHAFQEILQHLPPDTGLAFIFILHADSKRGSVVPVELLSKATAMPVVEAKSREELLPNHVYVSPPNAAIEISGGKLHLTARSGSGIQTPIDRFFSSLAEDRRSHAIAILLSGTGSDGTLGLKALKAAGGIALAQDSTAEHDAMPRSASSAGLVDLLAPPAGIAREIQRLSRHPFMTAPDDREETPGQPRLAEFLTLLRAGTGADFSLYKHGILQRRILRRMALNGIETGEQYATLLKSDRSEMIALSQEILIHATGFFREPATFVAVTRLVFPSVFRNRPPESPVHVWVPGCSTGEDAYSLAICFLEYMRDHNVECSVQIFGTDLGEPVLEHARAGIYPESTAKEVGAGRLQRFFVRVDGQYQVNQRVRDLCTFAHQSLTSNPPLPTLDLIIGRNVLIYLDDAAQLQVMRVFHHALKPDGYLVLGLSETTIGPGDLFRPIDRRLNIYSRKSGGSDLVNGGIVPSEHDADVQRRVNQLILDRHSPAGVVIDQELKIVQLRGRPPSYLTQPTAEPVTNLGQMLRADLMVPFHKLLDRARRKRSIATGEVIRVAHEDGFHNVRLSVTPLDLPGSDDAHFLVLFEEFPEIGVRKPARENMRPDARRRIKQLEEELLSTRQYLESVIEAHRAATEELKSANEVVQSNNEELQSANEELLTAKEELQSTNEEITALNQDMQSRNAELRQSNHDLNNLLASVHIPIVMLGTDLRIRRFTPQAERVLNLLPSDVGRRLSDFKPKIDLPDLEDLFRDVIDNLHVREREVQDQEGRWYSMWIRPYRTEENRIDGAVMVLVEITDRKLAAEARYRHLFEASKEGILLASAETGAVIDLNPCMAKTFSIPRSAALGVPYWELEIFRDTPIDAHSLSDLRENQRFLRTVALNLPHKEPVEVEVAGNLYQEADRQVIQLNLREIHESKRSFSAGPNHPGPGEESQSMEAIGRIAANLANDFSDLLTTIVGYTQLIAAGAHLDDAAISDLEKIRQAAFRADRLTHELLVLGRLQPVQMEITSLNDLLRGLDRTIRQSMPPGIQVMTDLSHDVKPVNGDRGQLEQAIMSLVLNARDVMPGGGTVLISTRNTSVDDAYSREHPAVPPGEYVVLEVSDTRSGRERAGAQGLTNLFEFFSTGRNAGQGLSIFSTVRQHGGFVWAATELGRGGTCRIYLPRIDVLVPADSEAAQAAGMRHGSETVLLVEGDELLRGLTSRTLSQCGYRVIDAPDGTRALESLAASASPVALTLADVVLPDMHGVALLKRISAVSPQTRFLLMTGNPPFAGVLSGQPQGTGIIQKPFTPEALSQRIRAILDST